VQIDAPQVVPAHSRHSDAHPVQPGGRDSGVGSRREGARSVRAFSSSTRVARIDSIDATGAASIDASPIDPGAPRVVSPLVTGEHPAATNTSATQTSLSFVSISRPPKRMRAIHVLMKRERVEEVDEVARCTVSRVPHPMRKPKPFKVTRTHPRQLRPRSGIDALSSARVDVRVGARSLLSSPDRRRSFRCACHRRHSLFAIHRVRARSAKAPRK
jgi:hypothetical protein